MSIVLPIVCEMKKILYANVGPEELTITIEKNQQGHITLYADLPEKAMVVFNGDAS